MDLRWDDALRERFFRLLPRYRHVRTLGRGGMAIVYEALDLELEERVAIKLLLDLPDFEPEELRCRFKREVSLNRRIKHRNVARLHDFATAGPHAYVTLEFVEGRNLGTLLEAEGALAPERAAGFLRQAARGLAAAHELSIVHRDVKPANLMVTPKEELVILDFGLARSPRSRALTAFGTAVGTPHYMSPEQAAGEPTCPASDVYSLGVVAFEMLTGAVPFDAASAVGIARQHLEAPAPVEPLARAGAPLWLREVVLRCLEKDPRDRFASARELARCFGPRPAARRAPPRPEGLPADLQLAV